MSRLRDGAMVGQAQAELAALALRQAQANSDLDGLTATVRPVLQEVVPGVTRAAFVWGLPLTGNKWSGTMELVGQPGSARLADQLRLPLRSVTPPDRSSPNQMLLMKSRTSCRSTRLE